MYVRAKTWLPHNSRRGVGDLICPDGTPAPCPAGVTPINVPAVCVPGAIDPITGDTIASCGTAAVPGVPSVPGAPSPFQATGGGFCLTPAFPWVGSTSLLAPSYGLCVPAFSVPAPWGMVITGVVVAGVLWNLVGGRR